MSTILSIPSLRISSRPWEIKEADKGFPVFYSTLAPDALTSLVFSSYAIEVTKSCQFWHRGLSDVYLLETIDNSYILRVSHCHWRSKIDIDFELEFLEFLDQYKIPIACPLRTKTGSLSIEINAPEGKRYAALFPYAPGEVALGDLNPIQSRLLGETVAKLHQAARNFQTLAYRQPLSLKYLLDDSLQIIAPFLHHRKDDLRSLVDTITKIKHQLQHLPTEAPCWGICWGDPHSGNVHFTPDNRMTLFDFDQCGYGWRAFDIAKFLQVSLQTGLSRTVRDAFLNGYQTYEQLTDGELAAIKALTKTAHIWAWAISLNNAKWQNYSRLDKSYFVQKVEQLKRLNSTDWLSFPQAKP